MEIKWTPWTVVVLAITFPAQLVQFLIGLIMLITHGPDYVIGLVQLFMDKLKQDKRFY